MMNNNKTKKSSIAAVAAGLLTAFLLMSGCANLLESSVEDITSHESTPYERAPAELIAISDIEELRSLITELIMSCEPLTTIQYLGTSGSDVQHEAQNSANDILQNDPVAAYAVYSIDITATRIIAYYEMVIEISFKKSLEQIQAIINASTQRYMITELIEIMSLYREEAVFMTNLLLDRDEIAQIITELYYQNPRRVVMLPFITVEVFPGYYLQPGAGDGGQTEEISQQPAGGPETYRIYEIKFGYIEEPEMLREIGGNLDSSVRRNAARADGDTDGEIILSLVTNLIAGAEYDEGTARTIAMHGPQNIAATAYGALVRGSAVGEGFAMAFKALCDELRLDCQVVLGYADEGRYHAWNIIALEGHYYHIDTAVCQSGGLETGFLKTDDEMGELHYIWGKENVPQCNGPLTLEDLLPPEEEPADPDDPDNPGGNGGPEDTGDPDDPDNPYDPEGSGNPDGHNGGGEAPGSNNNATDGTGTDPAAGGGET